MTPAKTSNQINADTTRDARQTAATGDASTVRSNNDQYSGKVTDTDYYKNETAAGSTATTQAYSAARRNLRQSMEAAGVSGASGVAAGNDVALDAQQASDLARVKTNAFSDTASQQLKANAQNLDLAKSEDATGEAYAGIGNADEQRRQEQGNANKMALVKAIASFGH